MGTVPESLHKMAAWEVIAQNMHPAPNTSPRASLPSVASDPRLAGEQRDRPDEQTAEERDIFFLAEIVWPDPR